MLLRRALNDKVPRSPKLSIGSGGELVMALGFSHQVFKPLREVLEGFQKDSTTAIQALVCGYTYSRV